MTAKWLVAKYMSDLRRKEPVNVGVILIPPDGEVRARFRALRQDGTLDGRSARWAQSLDNYRAHVEYWRHLASQGFDDESMEQAVRPIGDENYFLEFGGERLSGGQETIDADVLLDHLYAALVEETPEHTNLSVSDLSEAVVRQLALPTQTLYRDFELHATVGSARDAVVFDYRFDNGAVHLMRNVPLSFPDQRSWDAVHATLYSFGQAHQVPVEEGRPQTYIGFVKPRDDDGELPEQLAVLGTMASVVDVSDPDRASDQLAELLGVATN